MDCWTGFVIQEEDSAAHSGIESLQQYVDH